VSGAKCRVSGHRCQFLADSNSLVPGTRYSALDTRPPELQTGGAAKGLCLVGTLPGEFGLGAAEVAV
jgi:hypothetical protein